MRDSIRTAACKAASLRRLAADERGTTAIEYALIASSVSIFILTGVSALGTGIMTVFYEKITSLF
jgi:Flp pilus assembly pilin Flp